MEENYNDLELQENYDDLELQENYDDLELQENLDYLLTSLENALYEADNLDDEADLNLSREEIIAYLNEAYESIKNWSYDYNYKVFDSIKSDYSRVEALISELELCLADYEATFHMDSISYTLFQIGQNLSNI